MDLASLDAILAFAGLLEECNGSTNSASSSSSSTTGDPTTAPPSDLAALLPAAHARDAFRRRVRGALELIGSILDLFPLESLALTFNGGKDACVVFYLVRAAVAAAVRRRQPPEATREETTAAVAAALRRVAVLYFAPRHGEEFPEVAAFMEEVASGRGRVGSGASGGSDGDGGSSGDRGDLGAFEYTVYQAGYQEGMRDMVDNRGLKAVFMGVRSGDPYSLESEHVQPSSPGWAPFLRVNAILKWDYGHVWTFLRGFRLPYCCLYDHGYTSIGDVRTTVPNPALLRPEAARPHHNHDGDNEASLQVLPTDSDMYRPAYELEDYTLERANRVPYPTGAGKSPMAPSPPPPPPLPSLPSPTVSAEVGGLEGGDDDDAASAKSDATAAATAVAEGRRKRGSFCEQLRVAVICIGDFLSQRDSAPMALAHELRELRCLVAPLAIVPPQSFMVRAQLAHVLRDAGGGRDSETCTAAPPPPAVVFVLGIDEDAWSMAREVIGGLLACAPLTDGEGPSGDDAGEADADANERAGWRAATLHVASCSRVFLLAPAFACKSGECALSLEAQRNELDALLDAIAGGIPSMSTSVRHGRTPPRASSLPSDPVVVAARKGL